MNVLSLFARFAPNRVFVSMITGALGGLATALLVPTALSGAALTSRGEDEPAVGASITLLGIEISDHRFAAFYVALCVFVIAARSCSEILLARAAMDATREFRSTIYDRILKTSIVEIERRNPGTLLASITTDVENIMSGATAVPGLLASSVTVVGVVCYLFVIDTAAGWWVVLAIAIGSATYQLPVLLANRSFERWRRCVDVLYAAVHGLIHGAKQLRLNSAKRAQYLMETVEASEQAVVASCKLGVTSLILANNYGSLMNFITIGAMTFVFVSYHAIESYALLGVVMALLYIIGPIGVILGSVTPIAIATASLKNVNLLLGQMIDERVPAATRALPPWDEIRIAGAAFQHESPAGFRLSPAYLSLRRGEITFIVGGNGSGKTTLAKLISLLYLPSEGGIYFGGTEARGEMLDSCRQQISALFPDSHLFGQIMGYDRRACIEAARSLLREFCLDEKVGIMEDGTFSNVALSNGERRRLALVSVLVEDRPVVVLDEWAADQDPRFKAIFYRVILPRLRQQRRAVVIISHDERFFDIADRLVTVEDGVVDAKDFPVLDAAKMPGPASRDAMV